MPVWCGMGLGMWLRLLAQRPPLHVSRAARLAGITLAACVNSLLHLAENVVYRRRVERVSLAEPPLFLLGHWRSGTTLLHNLLAQDPAFVAPTQYQVSFPGHFLLTERPLSRLTAAWLPAQRPLDAMEQRWDLPGEDEMALLLTTLCSPYLRAAFPAGGDVDRLDDLRRNLSPEELSRWKQAFVTFLKRVCLRQPGTLLLKSPAHTGRIPLLLEMFPEARFVYIVRNPYDVFPSTLHLYKTLSESNSFTRTAPVDLEERVFSVYQRLYDAYHLQRALIPSSRRYELRFEDLVADPLASLDGLYRYLGLLNIETLQRRLEPQLVSHRKYRTNTYTLEESTRQQVYERWQPAFRRYGYLR